MSDNHSKVYIAGLSPMNDEIGVREFDVHLVRGRWRRVDDDNFGALSGFRATLTRKLSDPVRVDGRFDPSSYACFDREKAIEAAIEAAKRQVEKLRRDANKIEAAIASHGVDIGSNE